MSAVNNLRNKQALVSRLLTAKESTGKTFTQIAEEVGLTNVFTAQLFYNQVRPVHPLIEHSLTCRTQVREHADWWLQAQLKPDRVEKLKKAVPDLSEEDLKIMKRVPFRSYDPSIVTEPLIYRMQEVRHLFKLM
jgi:cyanate lyase